MKKLIAVLLAVMMVMLLAACGKGGTNEQTVPVQAPQTAPAAIAPSPKPTEEINTIPSYKNASTLKSDKCGSGAQYTLYDNGVLVIGGTGRIEGVKFSIFNNYTKYIVIENGITEISDSSFRDMTSLKIVELPDTIKVIEEGAFTRDPELESINFPNGLEIIGRSAFYNASITRIEIPSSVKSIGDGAFKMCSCRELILHEGIKEIGASAFAYNDSLEMVYIPGSVKKIGEDAFRSCKGLTTVVLGNGIETIGASAFQNIKIFAIPDSVIDIGLSKMGEPNPTNRNSIVYCNMNSYAADRFSDVADVIKGYDGFMKDFDMSKYK